MSLPRDDVRHVALLLQLPVHLEQPRSARGAALLLGQTRSHTMRFTQPVSSSSVTNMTPLALCGRWRGMTMPATRTRGRAASSCRSAAVSDARASAARAAARADGGRA